MLCIAGDTGTGSEVFIGVGICAFAVGRLRARLVASTNARGAALYGFRTDPLEAAGTVLAFALTHASELFFRARTDRIPVLVELGRRRFCISRIERNAGAAETEIIFEHGIVVVRVEGSVTEKGIKFLVRMQLEEIRENGF